MQHCHSTKATLNGDSWVIFLQFLKKRVYFITVNLDRTEITLTQT